MLQINSTIIWGEVFFCCFVFQKQAFEHHSLNANENSSQIAEMSLVPNLRNKMGTMVRYGCLWPVVPSSPHKGWRRRGGGESWTVIPATTQDPALPELGGTPYRIVLERQRRGVRGLGALHLQRAWFDGTMFIVVGTALGRPCSALWTNWGGNVGKNCKEMLSWLLGSFSFPF